MQSMPTGGCKYTFISGDQSALQAAISKYGNAPEQYKKRFENIDPTRNHPSDSELGCDTKRDPKTGKIRERYENGACSNCDGTGAKGKDRTGDDFPCPRCDGTGKSYIWRDKA